MTANQPATDHELSVEKLTGTSPERQRQFNALGWVYDIWGNCSVGRPTYSSRSLAECLTT